MSKPSTRTLMSAATMAVLAALHWTGAAAQVGHPPESSPYRFLDSRYQLTLVGGYALGNGGRVGVGPSTGMLGGVRLDLHLSGPATAGFGIVAGRLERRLLDPTEGLDTRDHGTAQQTVLFADAGFDLVFTGQKTWHGLAPYMGASLGLALGGSVPADSSTFQFSSKFIAGPRIGLRWHPVQRLAIRFEARDMIWQLKYPSIFFEDPADAPGTDPILDAATMKDTEWTNNPMLTVSVGYAFR